VTNVPGRKTGLAGAEWLAQLPGVRAAGRQLHPPGGGQGGPGLIRYRAKISRQRVPRSPGSATCCRTPGSRPASVASSIATKSGRAMTEALIDGERRGTVPAELAKGKMRSKIADLSIALEGRFGEHHAMLCRLHLDHIDHLQAMIAELDARIEAMMQPFRAARDLLVTIPGIGPPPAAAVISEIGPAPREYFPAAGQLASWAGLCPGNHESAGKRHSGRRRHGNTYLQPVLAVIAWAAIRHPGYLKSLYRRHVMRNGSYRSKTAQAKAIVTVAHAILVIIWHVLATGKPYGELGADYFTRRLDPERETRRLIARLEALGHAVTLDKAA